MRNKRQSILFLGAVWICNRISSFFGKSRWLKEALVNGYDRINGYYQKGTIGRTSLADELLSFDREQWRRNRMRAYERSRIRKWAQLLFVKTMSAPASYFAAFLFLGALFHITARILFHRSFHDLGFGIVLILSVAFFPLLLEQRPLLVCLRESSFFSKVDFGIDNCAKEEGKQRAAVLHGIVVILFSCCYGIVSALLPVRFWFLGTVTGVCIALFCLVPELALYAFLLFLPVFEFAEHKTLIVLLLVGGQLLTWSWKLFMFRRHITFSLPECGVLFLIFLYVLGGITPLGGFSALAQGCARALLLSLYFPACSFFSRKSRTLKGMGVLQASGFLVSLAGIVQYIRGDAILGWVDPSRFSCIGGRVTSCFSNPNVLAVYLLFLIPISLAYVLDRELSIVGRILFCLCFLCECGCLFLTWSRGAWLGCLISVLLLLATDGVRTRASLLLLSFPALCAVPFLPRIAVDRFRSMGDLGESSIRYRLYLWKGTSRMLLQNPWGIGVGEKTFMAGYLPYAVSGTETAMHTHQIFFQIWSEIGVIGCLVFIFLLALLFLLHVKGMKEPKETVGQAGLGGFYGLVGVLIMGLFDDIWYHNGLFCLFWVVFAMTRTNVGKEARYDG